MAIEQLPIFCYYDKQRFIQFGSMDCANWYGISVESGKKQQALYPAMGRKHINFLNENRLIFNAEPRVVFKTIHYFYVVDGNQVIQVDRFYNQKVIGTVSLGTNIWFDFLAVGTTIYALMTDEHNIFIITENGTTVSMVPVTDGDRPNNPLYVAAFGNRFAVSSKNTPFFYLTTINLVGGAAGCFSSGLPVAPLFAQATGVIGQMGVLHNQLYIFNDFTTDVWSNIPTQLSVAGGTSEFPWKLNTSYNLNYGIEDPFSLSIGFGRMVWLAQNADGLVSFMSSNGQQPQDISSQAINVLLENSTSQDGVSPFITNGADGFLYQYENTVFYRVSAGKFLDFGVVDLNNSANAVEYNFETGTWGRVIELNGERNRIQKHIYFNNKHLVTVSGDPAMYDMAGNIYYNELRNTAQTNPQAADAFKKYPMRYELVTKQIFLPDYAEFVEDYVEIDFVFGDQTFYHNCTPFLNTVFIVGEDSTDDVPVYILSEDDKYLIQEGTNTPTFDDNHYCDLFKPYIELYYSNDGGNTFFPADVREFSPLGQYRWRMRWYQLGVSRNRCYRLVCVSSAPIVILGGVRNSRRTSGGAN
jgi:hypothetical protein